MSYVLHPSEKLVKQFTEKPWQGCNPTAAKFLFIGLDANYGADIETRLPEVFDYLECGVCFWRNNKVHHPFLLPHYKGNGKKYHEKFAEIGFTTHNADIVSFVELLHLPTVGTNHLTVEDLSISHLKFLVNLLELGSARFVFLSSKVLTLLKQTELFEWLPRKPSRMDGDLAVLRNKKDQTIYQMYHLSCYGWQLEVLNRQIAQIRQIVKS
jgi:hypothetical protein